MMIPATKSTLALGIFFLLAGVVVARPESIRLLEEENLVLKKNLVAANRREKESAEALAKVKIRLEALGRNLIDGKDDRFVQALSDLQALDKRNRNLESAAVELSTNTRTYLKSAVVADADLRTTVEISLRKLDEAIGFGQKPRPSVITGDLNSAKVVSIDSQSGLLVFNVGSQKGVRIGMKFEVLHGNKPVAKAIIAEFRKDISGALIEDLFDKGRPVLVGDQARIILQ